MATIKKSIKNGTSYKATKVINNGIEYTLPTAVVLNEPSLISIDEDPLSLGTFIIKYSDSGDTSGNLWTRSILVRKLGSEPIDVNDGVQVSNSITRNQYSSNGYIDGGLASNTTYYYKVFSYDKYGNEYLSNTIDKKTSTFIPVELLLIGGGGGGSVFYGGGGGAGGTILCNSYNMGKGCHSVIIGSGGSGKRDVSCAGNDGCNSSVGSLIAYGGGGGGNNRCSCCGKGWNGGSGGGGYSGLGGTGCVGQGHNGGNSGSWSSGGGGGAGGAGCNGGNCVGGMGGIGIQSDISGTLQRYAGGGSGMDAWNGRAQSANCGGTASNKGSGGNATICGAGGGANCSESSGAAGGKGLFILRYPSSCGYNITGGTKYLCNGYCTHCFTSNGTLCVN